MDWVICAVVPEKAAEVAPEVRDVWDGRGIRPAMPPPLCIRAEGIAGWMGDVGE